MHGTEIVSGSFDHEPMTRLYDMYQQFWEGSEMRSNNVLVHDGFMFEFLEKH